MMVSKFERCVRFSTLRHLDASENAQAAYETSYTLLDTCLNKIDTHELLGRVLAGISDDNEIRAISYLMLIRLANVAPTTVVQRAPTSSC